MTVIKPIPVVAKSSSTDSLSKMSKSSSVESLQKMIKSPSVESLQRMIKSPSVESLTKTVTEKTISTAVQSTIPDATSGAFASAFFVYVITHRKTLQKRPSLVVSKKLAKSVSLSLSGVFLNSGVVGHSIDMISDHKLHLASEIVLSALKIALTCV